MAARTKTRRRLKLVGLACLALLMTGTAAYAIRRHQIARRVVAWRGEGYAALEAGDYFTAMHKIGPFLQRNRTDTEALFKYAQARQNVPEPNGRHIADALSLYRQLLEIDPQHEGARRQLLDLYVQYGLNTEILHFTKDGDDLHSRRAKVIALKRLRRFDEALPLAQAYNADDPLNLQQQILTLELMRQNGKPASELIQRAQTLREQQPDDARFELLQSIAYGAADDEANALKWARQAAQHPIDDADFVQALVAQLDALRCFEQSLSVLEQAAGKAGSTTFQIAAIRRLLDARQYQAVADRLATLDPADKSSHTDLLALRAIALLKLNQRPQAEAIIRGLAERKHDLVAPKWADVLDAVFSGSTANDRQIIRACKAAIQNQPDNPYFHYYLGEAYTRAGDDIAARTEFVAAHELSRAWAAPLNKLAALLAPERPGAALDLAQAARDRAPDDPAVLSALALARVRTLTGPDSAAVAEVFALLDRIEQLDPRNEDARILRVSLLASLDRKTEAEQALDAALALDPPLNESTLLQLASVSRNRQLGREEACFARSDQAHGLTADLALARAAGAFRRANAEAGAQAFESARQKAVDAQSKSWRLARARYLELVSDPHAIQEWMSLASDYPDDPVVQQTVLAAPSAWRQRQFIRQTIDRLADILGDDAVAWRIADAQWLVEGEPTEQDVVKATVILNDLTRRFPDHLPSRRLLAQCLARLGKTDDAIEQYFLASQLAPQSNEILLPLAALLHSQGDFKRAQPLLGQVQQNLARLGASAPQQDWTALATLLRERGDIEHSMSILRARAAATTQPSDADIQLAMLYAQRGELTEQFCEKLLLNPDPRSIAIVAGFYADRGDRDEAGKLLRRLDEMKLTPGVAQLVRARFFEQHGSDDEVVEQLTAAVNAAPNDPRMWRALIAHHLLRGRAESAMDAARKAQHAIPADEGFARLVRNEQVISEQLEYEPARVLAAALLDPTQDSGVVLEALQVMSAATRDGATVIQVLPKLRPLADRAPRLLALQQLVATVALVSGQNEDALKVSSRTMQLLPNEPEPARVAAQALAMLGRWSEALSTAEQWKQRLHRASPQADALIATAYLALGNNDAALRAIDPHLQGALADPVAHQDVIRIYMQASVVSGNTDAVAKNVEPVLSQSEQIRSIWMQLAGQAVADPDTAQQWLVRVEPLVDQSSVAEKVVLAQAWVLLAHRTNLKAHHSSAALALEKASRDLHNASHSTPREWEAVGMLHDAAGKPDLAEVNYRKALQLNADLPVAQNNLAMIVLNRSTGVTEALELAQKAAAHRDHPLRGSFLDTLALVQLKLKQYDAAAASLNDAITLEPGNLKWRVNLAQVLAESGQRDKAKAVLREIDTRAPQLSQVSPTTREQIEALRSQLK